MNIISVEYEVLVGVKIDMDSGEVVQVVAHTEEFNAVVPYQVYAGGYEATASLEELPEYLPDGHPLRKRALDIADRVKTVEVDVPFTVRP